MRVIVENGPKGKKVVATAFDWPGLERNGKTEQEAIEKLEAYLPRYLKVAKRARLGKVFSEDGPIEVVERYDGTGSTDFWGISFAPGSMDRVVLEDAEFERWIKLLQACWAEFDEVAGRVTPELRKGPRGGGRDRDQIVGHVVLNEHSWTPNRVGDPIPDTELLTPEGMAQHRKEYLEALRREQALGTIKIGRSWTLNYLIRHTAYHVLDHAWEMEAKDLTEA